MSLVNDLDQTPPQTEDAAERGFVDKVDDENLGRSDAFDEDNTGDIADEGPGHRG